MLIYRVLYSTVGLHSYLPYQLLALGTHITIAALLFTIIRRQGVDPWIATAAASLFVMFGRGAGDIVVAFQITFTLALMFGLIQLLLVDHDGPLDRRDWIGLAAGLAALCCSGVGVAMVVLVGVGSAMFGELGFKAAANSSAERSGPRRLNLAERPS